MTPPPPRPSGSIAFPATRGMHGSTVDAIRSRVLARAAEKLDPARLKRMPESIMRQDVRRALEQLIESEGPRLGRPEREALLEALLRETIGFGPLEELFREAAVKEVLVLNAQTVLARREGQSWAPTNVKFRDTEHVRQLLDKVLTHAEPVGERLPSAALDVKLSNGFRVLAVVPPTVLDWPPSVAFVRQDAVAPASASGTVGMAATTRSAPVTLQPSGPVITPPPRVVEVAPASDLLARLQLRVTERILSKLASLGVSDIYRVDTRELHRVVNAYVIEMSEGEKVRLSELDQTRLAQQILASLRP